ncbi:MAG: ribonuclease Z [Solirubrobacterales bacterium]|nr:ribonuclease Z [Solirubrobacterales bacterium]MCB8915345.1 ribonuclease Z [Thermoleophilales bacterium]
MDLSVAFLGTGGPVPTALRGTASVLVTRGGEKLMFDCGEGTQRQLRRSMGLVQVDEIYLTHFHLDHCLGLPGLLKTYDLNDREEPLLLFGPAGLNKLMKDLQPLIGRLGFHLEIDELAPGDILPHVDYEIEAFPVEHRTSALGYALLEDDRPGRFDPDEAVRLGVEPGPAFKALQDGEEVDGRDGKVRPDQVMGDDRLGRAVAITGDTRPCQATVEAAREADLLVHDASFMVEDDDRAEETGHSTGTEAAEVAAEAGAKMLALVHISSRYHVGRALEEAKAVFSNTIAPRDFDTVEIPFPERGEPELVPGGAKREAKPDRK